jgi:hypothetical protein
VIQLEFKKNLLPIAVAFILPALFSQQASKGPYLPTPAEIEVLRTRTDALAARLKGIAGKAPDDLFADVEIYHKAAEWILRFPEQFYRPDYYSNALKLLEDGMRRADELEHGAASWPGAKGAVCRGYRSHVDDSIQPYCMWVPESYDPKHPARLDVILHGRSGTLQEVNFIASGQTGRLLGSESGRTAATIPIAGRVKRMSLRRSHRSGRSMPSILSGPFFAASPWAAPGHGTWACIFRRGGLPWKPAPATSRLATWC